MMMMNSERDANCLQIAACFEIVEEWFCFKQNAHKYLHMIGA